MFNKLAEKLTGRGIDECVLRSHASRNKLYELIDKIKVREAQLNGTANKDRDQVLQKLNKELNEVRAQYAVAEASLEKAKAEQSGLISLVGLLTASIQAGRDTKELEAVISTTIGEIPSVSRKCDSDSESVQDKERKDKYVISGRRNNEEDMETGIFKILEIRESSPGTIRAWSEDEEKEKIAIYVKNGLRQKAYQAEELGKKIFVKYRQGDKGLIAYGVEVIG